MITECLAKRKITIVMETRDLIYQRTSEIAGTIIMPRKLVFGNFYVDLLPNRVGGGMTPTASIRAVNKCGECVGNPNRVCDLETRFESLVNK